MFYVSKIEYSAVSASSVVAINNYSSSLPSRFLN